MEGVVVEIQVMAGDLVDHIEFVFDDGSRQLFGRKGGRLREPFRLEAGERLVSVTAQCGDSLDGCSFTTSTGRTSEWFGGHGGRQHVHRSSHGQHIVGLQMAPGNVTQRILGIVEAGVAAPDEPLELSAELDAPTQQRLLSIQGSLRRSLQALLPGDEVCLHDGRVGCVRHVHEDRTATVASTSGAESWRPLLRDLTLTSPAAVGFPHSTTIRDQLDLVSWAGTCRMDHTGRCSLNGSLGVHDDREGVHLKKLIATSKPVPEGVRVVQVMLDCDGMDQGWGNTGEAGVHVAARTPGDALGDERVLAGVLFDRGRSRGRRHKAEIAVAGLAGPQPGDVLQIWLKCPTYPGWSADCSSVAVRIGFERDEPRQGLGKPHADALEAAADDAMGDAFHVDLVAFRLLWDRLGDDAFLAVDPSHLSLSGLRRQGAWTDPKDELGGGAPLLQPASSRVASLLRKLPDALAPAERLVRRLEQNEATAGSPQEIAARRARYDQLLRAISRTLDGLVASAGDKWPPPLAEQVLAAYADAEPHCLYRWEREIFMCHDLVNSDDGAPALGVDALPLEDIVLRILHGRRRRIAEAALHRAKGQAGNSDMHFDSYFYANVHFGVLEQRDALLDPNRLNYAQLGTGLDFGGVQAALMGEYSPAHIRSIIREELVDSTAEGAETLRGKLHDALRAAMPAGFRPHLAVAERQEAWLFEQCHDEAYRVLDPALNLLLCRFRVLSAARVADLFRAAVGGGGGGGASSSAGGGTGGGAPLAPGSMVRLHGLQARPELNGQQGVVLGRRAGSEDRWEVRVAGDVYAMRAASLEALPQPPPARGLPASGAAGNATRTGWSGPCSMQ